MDIDLQESENFLFFKQVIFINNYFNPSIL